MARVAVLSFEERTRHTDACKRAWLVRNYEYNRMQKRIGSARPEHLAKRRQQYRERITTQQHEAAKVEEAETFEPDTQL